MVNAHSLIGVAQGCHIIMNLLKDGLLRLKAGCIGVRQIIGERVKPLLLITSTAHRNVNTACHVPLPLPPCGIVLRSHNAAVRHLVLDFRNGVLQIACQSCLKRVLGIGGVKSSEA